MSSVRRRLLAAIAGSAAGLPAIGEAFMGGYFAGVIDTTVGNIIAADASQTGLRYALIVAPKSLEAASLSWSPGSASAPAALTRWDGLSATAAMASATYPAANYCAGLTAPSDAASAWYLPALDELELVFRNLKPVTANNSPGTSTDTFPGSFSRGANPSSDPVGAAYTSTAPGQTTVTAFMSGGSEALEASSYHWSATEASSGNAWRQNSSSGIQAANAKSTSGRLRPVRRLLL